MVFGFCCGFWKCKVEDTQSVGLEDLFRIRFAHLYFLSIEEHFGMLSAYAYLKEITVFVLHLMLFVEETSNDYFPFFFFLPLGSYWIPEIWHVYVFTDASSFDPALQRVLCWNKKHILQGFFLVWSFTSNVVSPFSLYSGTGYLNCFWPLF